MTIIEAHEVKSREVTPRDFDRISQAAEQMFELMDFLIAKKVWPGIFALAHSQVTDQDPLRFFVLHPMACKALDWTNSPIVVNPTFTPGTHDSLKDESEQCITFPKNPATPTKRYYRGTATWIDPSGRAVAKVIKGRLAQVFQHETDHFNAKYIYQPNEK